MMRGLRLTLVLGPTLLVACAGPPDKGTLAQLHEVPADVKEVEVEQGLDKAMQSYRRYLEETPRTAMTPEARPISAILPVDRSRP